MRIFINGKFLSQKITGVQRYALETTKALDKLVAGSGHEIILLSPSDAIQHPRLENIKTQVIGGKGGMFWSQWTAPLYARKHGGVLLTITGQCPILAPDYLVFHDIVYMRYPESYSMAYKLVYNTDYKLTLKRVKRIFTVSGFTRDEVTWAYGLDPSRITVAYNASTHMQDRVFGDVDLYRWGLTKEGYYLSVGSVNLHKNQQYILRLAEKYPDKTFVIVGNVGGKAFNAKKAGIPANGAEEQKAKPSNVIYTGYLEDDELAALYKNAAAFIFPSKYEGFGIPPLEAITLGTRHIAVSDIKVFREVFDRGVVYFDPDDPDTFDPEALEQTEITDEIRDYYLSRFTWEKTARTILDGIVEAEGKA